MRRVALLAAAPRAGAPQTPKEAGPNPIKGGVYADAALASAMDDLRHSALICCATGARLSKIVRCDS